MVAPSPHRYSDEERRAKIKRRVTDPVPCSPWISGSLGEKDIGDIHLVPPETLVQFFANCAEILEEHKGSNIGDYIEFGVFNGSSIGSAWLALQKSIKIGSTRLFGCDAYEGLPAGSESIDDGVWEEGGYRCSFEKMKECLQRRDINPDDINWVNGWYEETLTDDLARNFNLSNLGIIFIDCDTYDSSQTALKFVAPLISSPVIICLDDWKLNDLDVKGLGEYKSFNEFLEENPHLTATEIPSYNRKSKSFLIAPTASDFCNGIFGQGQ